MATKELTEMTPEEREQFGRAVRVAWVAYCYEIGDKKPSHIAPWEEISEEDREADRRIAEAVVRLWAARQRPDTRCETCGASMRFADARQHMEVTGHDGYSPVLADDTLDILTEHQERADQLDRIERERARQEATQPRGACLHVLLRLGDGDECVCVKCSLPMTATEAQRYLNSLSASDRQKSLLERLSDANKG